MRLNKGLAMVAAAGLSGAAHAQEFTLNITADKTTAVCGDTITWTVSLTGDFRPNVDYLGAYDLDFNASDPSLGTASPFLDQIPSIVTTDSGTPSGASIAGTAGGQSSILDFSLDFGPIVIGSFTVEVESGIGSLSYTVADGGQFASVDGIRVQETNDFFPASFNGIPNVDSDVVNIVCAACDPPVIVQDPVAASAVDAGDPTVTLAVSATDADTYQWRRDGEPLTDGLFVSGTNTASLSVAPTIANAGVYDVVVENSCGMDISTSSYLVVRQSCIADLTGDGQLTLDDIQIFVDNFLGGCP